MTKKLNKRGFTIVELVVVIVVIAILAAVLIPTISNLVSKANKNKDTQLVRNLNTALAADVNKHNTMSEALAAAAEFGYDVAKINASEKDNEILWDSVNDVFCYLDENKVTYIPDSKDESKTVNPVDYWQICTSVPTTQKYSIYWNGNVGVEITDLQVGFDSGNTSGNTITYTGDSSVRIRTNTGDSLTVNNDNATVSHYGEANVVTITAVKGNSYHEFGKVLSISLAKGRVVVENNGTVDSIIVTASSSGDVKIEAESGGTLNGVAATDSTVANGLGDVVTGVANEVVSTEVVSKDFAGGIGTEAAPYLIATCEQWTNLANICKEENNGSKGKYYKVTADLDFTNYSERVSLNYLYGNIDFDNHKVLNVQINDKQFPEEKTVAKPGGKCYSYPLIANVYGDCTIENLADFNVYCSETDVLIRLIHWTNNNEGEQNTVTLKNISISGSVVLADNNTGLFIKFANSYGVVLENCTNNANIFNSGLTAAFVGSTYRTNHDGCDEITFRNCINNGSLTTTSMSNNAVGILISNANGDKAIVNIENCINTGSILSLQEIKNYACGGVIDNYTIRGDAIKGADKFVKAEAKAIVVSEQNTFTVPTIEGATSYKMVFTFSGAAVNSGVASVTFALDSNSLNSVAAYGWKFSESKENGTVINNCKTEDKYGTIVKTIEIDGTTYYVADVYSTTNAKPTVTVYGYAEDGGFCGYATYQYAE